MSNDAVDSLADRPAGASGAAQPVRRSGRGLAAFALLVALSALGLAAYPYYRQLTAPTSIDGLDALRVAQQRQADELQRVIGNSAEIESQLRRQQQRIDESAAASPTLGATMATPSVLTPESQHALQLAQSEYLLRNANDRLLVQRDVTGALTLLLAAQSLVSQVDGPGLAPVRDELAKEVEALRGDSGVDLAAVSARLQALAGTVLDLPTRGARFSSTQASVAPETALPMPAESTLESAGRSAWQKFRSLFEFRRQGGAPRPPLGPDEAAYLRLNLALQLQIAELALLRNDASVYQQSLGAVRRWLDDYLDPAAASVTMARAEIDQLLTVRLDRALPNISGSLNALRPLLDAQAPPPVPVEPAAAAEGAATQAQADSAPAAAGADQ